MSPPLYNRSNINHVQKYSSLTGLVYIFNLIVGTGALTLPGAFVKAGWVLGVSFILVLAFMSFITATFVIEAMAIGNAVLVKKKKDKASLTDESFIGESDESNPLIPPSPTSSSLFEINHRLEMGRLASMFFGRLGLYLFYLCLAIYLYGDLTIYISAVAKSLRDVACVFVGNNSNINGTLPDDTFCWSEAQGMTRHGAYHLFTVLFLITLGPFAFFNVSKTKYLQILTSGMRWTAFLLMIGLGVWRIAVRKADGAPPAAVLSGLPNLFGICVYSFMCHHSLPSIVTPIKSKRKIYALLAGDYLLIGICYLFLALSAIFAFHEIKDLYTLNFVPEHGGTGDESIYIPLFQYFLSLFPVFTLSTNFPIIAITLRNNLQSLFYVANEEYDIQRKDDSEEESGELGYPRLNNSNPAETSRVIMPARGGSNWSILCGILRESMFPLLAVIPPFLLAILVDDVGVLVGVTGSYAGSGIQYLIPVFLVSQGRKRVGSWRSNPYVSPFTHWLWLWFVVGWAAVSISFLTVNRLLPLSFSSSIAK